MNAGGPTLGGGHPRVLALVGAPLDQREDHDDGREEDDAVAGVGGCSAELEDS
jgi:hypothetical protein